MAKVDVAKHLQRTRPPARVISGDDFQTTQDGVLYYPHRGEEIRIVGSPSAGWVEDLVRFRALLALVLKDGGGMMSIEEGTEAGDIMARLLAEFHSRVVSWTWTDPFGKVLPEKPSLAHIRALPFDEFMLACLAFAPPLPSTVIPVKE